MIIDYILDRRGGEPYDYEDFKQYVKDEERIFGFKDGLHEALSSGDEAAAKKALCSYILSQGYNREICKYVNSVAWTTDARKSSRTRERGMIAAILNMEIELLQDREELKGKAVGIDMDGEFVSLGGGTLSGTLESILKGMSERKSEHGCEPEGKTE